MLLVAGSVCRGEWYTPTSTVLDADTGKSAWEGPNDSQNLGTQTGTHSANSNFTYFSGWAQSNVNCAATSSASLNDAGISLYASNSTGGYGYAYTQAIGSATVDFTLASSQWLILNDSSTYADPRSDFVYAHRARGLDVDRTLRNIHARAGRKLHLLD